MPIDFEALVLRPIHAILGTTLSFKSPVTNGVVEISAVDKTKGLEIQVDKASFPTIKPAATVLASDLAALNIDAQAMRGVFVSLNGKRWRVETTKTVPNPSGEAKGEVVLILSER